MNGPVDYMAALLLVDPTAEASTRTVEVDGERVRANVYRYECIQRTDQSSMPSKTELDAAWANHTPPLQWNRTQLLALFTRGETRWIRAHAMADPDSASAIVLDELERRPADHLYRSDSTTLIELLDALVADGALSAHRPAEILAGVTPS